MRTLTLLIDYELRSTIFDINSRMGDSYDLSPFGWEGCTIPMDLKDVCKHLPSWKNLKTLRKPQVLSGFELYFPHKMFKTGENIYMPGYIKGDIDDDGGYAQIYKSRRALFKLTDDTQSGSVHLTKSSPFADLCIKEVRLNITPDEQAAPLDIRIKTYEEEIHAILYEAFLHTLLYKTLEKEGFPSAVPRIYEVLANTNGKHDPETPCDFESIWINMEYVNGVTLEKFLKKQLVPFRRGNAKTVMEANETLLIDVLIQLAFYLQILQEKVRFNHRDLKINNVFVRHHNPDEGWNQSLTIPGIGTWNCKNDIVMIDFGFSCIACGSGFLNPRATLVGAGSWFKSEHDCLKFGRDLGQFLYSIHCMFPLQEYVSPELFTIIHKLLIAERGNDRVDLMMGLDNKGNPIAGSSLPRSIKFNDGIYVFLRDSHVDVPGCNPTTFLQSIASYTTI